MQQPVTPGPQAGGSAEAGDGFVQELAAVRSHLRLVDELDQQTADMVGRLAEAVRSSTEVRAQVGHEITASLARIERVLTERRLRQRDAIVSLRDEVRQAHARALDLATAVRELEQDLTNLGGRVSDATSDTGDDGGSAGTAEQPTASGAEVDDAGPALPAPTPIGKPETAPQPAASSMVIAVERVPSASVALSIQRFVAGLPGVVAATTREFAAGQLRLEVMSRGAIRVDEIRQWPGGRLEVIQRDGDGVSFRIVA